MIVLSACMKTETFPVESKILEKIYQATLQFLVPLTPQETYAAIVREAIKLVGGDAGRIVLEEDGDFKVVYTSAPVAKLPKVVRKKGFVYTAFKNHKAFLLTVAQIAAVYPDIAKMGIQSAVLIPLSYRGKAIGVLAIESYRPGYFSTKELEILKVFGSMASLQIRNIQLYEETKKNLETRDLFISLAAHELRTPITTIFGYAQLLHNKIQGKDRPEFRWINALHAESYRLTLLVKDLLEINRIRTGKMQYLFRECPLKEAVKRAIDNFKFNYPDRVIIFEDELDRNEDLIVGDFDKLLQVLINLLDNAAKFSAPESKVQVILRPNQQNLVLQVKDQGTGITKKDLPKVFDGFYQGRGGAKEGMGLGLYLCKNIIEEHRGTIHMHSKLGKGTLVEVQLPKAKI